MAEKSHWKLTEEQRQMYAAERLENFRWISQVVASYSPRHLTSADIVPAQIQNEIAEIGQFSEIVYSTIPIESLLQYYSTLALPGFPLERYHALHDVVLKDFFAGDVASLPAAIFYRPSHKQIVIAISGTSRIEHTIQDLRALRTKHPSGKGSVHTGFWALYKGLEARIKVGLLRSLDSHSGACTEVVLTGHSMGGALAYLLCIDLLSHDDLPPEFALKVVAFGTPRAGDAALVSHYHSLVKDYQDKHGKRAFTEYSLRAFNDGVPTLPPLKLGFRHFCNEPIYTTGNQLYYVPSSECERTLFRVEGNEGEAPCFPRGGHNYYNGRELEKLLRTIGWLEKADLKQAGWEERYQVIVQKKR